MRLLLSVGAGCAIALGLLGCSGTPESTEPYEIPKPYKVPGAPKVPSDWFLQQRTYPHDDIVPASRLLAWEQAKVLRAESVEYGRSAAVWNFEGPTNIGGRIADLAVHPTDPNTAWVGAAEGGVLKTTDGGTTWIPTMDFESSLSIGSIAVDPTDPQILYVGTGEPNGGGGSVTYGGTGVFKSTDGGGSWTNVGLPDSRYIGRVVVDPSAPNRIFVAVLGSLFSTGPDRGVYRSTDSGATWSHVLAVNDTTGAVDVAVDPGNSNLVYAATWQRLRAPDNLDYGGDGSGIWKSTDGGDTWNELTSGLPSGTGVGRIGIAIAPTDPDILYAIYAEANPGAFTGLYRTTNGGSTWTQTNDSALFNVYASFGWWFGNVRVDPTDADVVFAVGFEVWRSQNAGSSWSNVGSSMHVDHHALEFASNGDIYEGNDGGMYKSVNGGSSWSKLPNLPATQFYAVEVDEQFPNRHYGGTQDNGTNRTLTGALTDWSNILGGDGFTCLVNPTDNSRVYAEFQNGGFYRSTNGGSSFTSAGTMSGRKNWHMPYVFDPSDPSRIFAGTDRVYRSTNHAASFTAISSDLTDGPGTGNRTYGTLTTLAVAATDANVIWAGTDDANVWVTTNGGGSWTQVDAALPDRWITRVAVDPQDETVSYVTVSGFRWDEPEARVFRSTDFGATWTPISSNLPEAPVNDLIVDPVNSSTLYVGTDVGVYWTTTLGASWSALGTGLPNVVVNDLRLHAGTGRLYAGTYGRSMWSFDLSSTTETPAIAALARTFTLDPPAPNPVGNAPSEIRFVLERAAPVTLDVFDVSGRRVANLTSGSRAAGSHSVAWDGRDDRGFRVSSGTYFVRLEVQGAARTRKVTVLN
ncbi:MAG: T9SS type A sorting domain-containing protein [Gemmatimonadetes bacterium]|nr:T9SS type A sorting domain-containing protein [Gemmatimonadota bacterium]